MSNFSHQSCLEKWKILAFAKTVFIVAILFGIGSLNSSRAASLQPVDEALPLVGTGGHGHTYPGATVPFGFVQLSPDTPIKGWDACGGYHYSDSAILGFSHTHLSGTGIGDYGDFLLTPYVGDSPAPSHFNHSSEIARPGYYRVMLEDFKIQAEL